MSAAVRWSFVLLLLALQMPTLAADSVSKAGFSTVQCEKVYRDVDSDAIIRGVFIDKYLRLASQKPDALNASGVTSLEFVKRNAGLVYAICDSRGSFDSLSVDKVGVVFDIKLIALLAAQARALILGAMVNKTDQFDIHRRLMTAFIKEGATRSINPLEQLEWDAATVGIKTSDFQALVNDPTFQKREQTLFLAELYFLSMHERCHFALGHHAKIDAILKLPETQRLEPRQQLELDADKCAISIINFDEGGLASSPIAYFGAIAVVTTQAIVSSFDSSTNASSHPASRARLAQAQHQVASYIEASQNPAKGTYRATVDGASVYMGSMFDKADEARKTRSSGR